MILATVLVAAFTDVRKGVIPNWLTYPLLIGAPIVHGVTDGAHGLLASIVGMLFCALVPLVIFYRQGMAGGDVKLFAALGAVGGVYVGLEVELLALICASIYALGYLAWNGRLLSGLLNSLLIGVGPVLPKRFRRPMASALMHRIRLGAAVALGAFIAVSGHHREVFL
ncbi:MAG: prepilin peptidase [Sandaracinaceae bacterium]